MGRAERAERGFKGPKGFKGLKDFKDLKKDVRRWTQKNAKCEVNFVPNEKASPQFAFANEELAYRSAVQNSPAICVFYAP